MQTGKPRITHTPPLPASFNYIDIVCLFSGFSLFGNLLLCLSAEVNVDLEHFPEDLVPRLPVIKMENNSNREGGEAASGDADNRKAPPLEQAAHLFLRTLLSFSLSRHAQNFAHKFKSKQGMGTSSVRARGRDNGGEGAAALRPQMAKRVRSGFRFSYATKAKQSKVKNFANYAKANRQKVNINIHLVEGAAREGERGEGSVRCLLTMARQMPSKLKMRRKT